METRLIQSIFHAMVRAAEERNGGKKIRNEEKFRAIFKDAKFAAKSRLDEVTFDDVLGID